MKKLLILLFSILISLTSMESWSQSVACWESSDGSSVSCGGGTPACWESSDGSSVSCGGESIACWESSDGSSVSCGGSSQ
ncbi:hypothetical protein PQZ70_00015 [Candidatus Pseudothioglobus singularis]|jgi:hypothetical protein|nr:hypothetical protein [Candidatus Pseudothioglobus singularis]